MSLSESCDKDIRNGKDYALGSLTNLLMPLLGLRAGV